MKEIAPAQLIEAMEWRYSAKSFDPTQKISAENISALERSLLLTPSSYGLQPWNFLIVQEPVLREQLRFASWNQRQVTECSHFVIFAQKTSVDETYVDRYIATMAAVREMPIENFAGLKKGIMSDVIHGPRSKYIAEWAARQNYIALGNLMTSAALLGIDSCPMEGFDPAKYDEILALSAQGLSATVACALGYRHPEDRFSTFKKVRFSHEELIKRI